ncbi:MAG: hypothetical protein JNK40_00530 [Chromatiales bacterium]|nr:hypothetical protein [Chromatiales bacterium]
MKRLFIIAFVAGLLAVAVAATLWPFPEHVRYRSISSVPADGGRMEEFVIHWPEDRIARPRERGAALPAAAAVGAVVLEDSAGRRVSAELFRLRDTEDNVIGVAGRLAGTGGAIADRGRSASNWLLVIPSRGALFLAQSDVLDTTVREGAAAEGSLALAPAQAAAFWTDRPRIRITSPAPAGDGPGTTRPGTTGRVLRGTSEFAGLRGSFTETWDLEEVNADGSTRGRILLSTITVGAN